MNKGYFFEKLLVDYLRSQFGEESAERVFLSGAAKNATATGQSSLREGDVILKKPIRILFECKHKRVGKVFYIELSWIDQIKEEAENSNCIPCLAIRYKGQRNGTFFIFPFEFFELLKIFLKVSRFNEIEIKSRAKVSIPLRFSSLQRDAINIFVFRGEKYFAVFYKNFGKWVSL